MVSNRTVILDCGASRTALGVFSRNGSRLRLEQSAVEILPGGAGSEDNWLTNTRAALKTLRRATKAVGPALLVLPSHLSLTKLLKTPRVEPAQRDKVIRFEAGQNIPYALNDVVWDSVVIGETATELDVLLAAARLDVIEPLCTAVQEAGFTLSQVLPSSLGTLAAFRLLPAATAGTSLVLNLGARSTTLLLVERDRFAVRTFSLGGNSVTQQIAENQDCDFQEAEEIKLSERSADLIADAVASMNSRLAQEVTRSVLHFKWRSGMETPARIFLTGGGARLTGLREALATKLKIPIEPLEVMSEIDSTGPTGATFAITDDLVGAAATQLRPKQSALNLLPPSRRQVVTNRQRQPWLIAAAVLTLGVMLPPLIHFRAMTNEARKKTSAIERELVPLREREVRNRAKLQRVEELKGQIARVEALQGRRTSWLGLLGGLQERLVRVEDVWLEKLQPATGTAGTPLRLVVAGRLLDRSSPLARPSPEAYRRATALLSSLVDSPFVAAVESERFDGSQPGILKFEFVLVTKSTQPL